VAKLGKLSAVFAALLLIAGCSSKPVHAGAAARVGDTVIKQQTVTSQLAETIAQIKSTPGSLQATDAGSIGQKIVNRIIVADVVDRGLARVGKKITSAEVTNLRNSIYLQYGQDAVEQQLASAQGVPKSQIDEFFRTVLAQGYIGSAILPKGSEQERSQATGDFLLQLASTIEIEVSPRYGTWNPNQLQVTGADNALSFAQQSSQ
jgi:hypothetical protein